ncbi:MAG: hypothetical protein QM572_03680 [Nocardioides sp.]|uniref:hypothetical protein n=1 Tax=Nocardioides sp. TaxID=35761 RepID=UPI0039E4803A
MTLPPEGPGWGQAPPPPPPGPAPAPGSSDGYSVGDALSYGWAKFQSNLGPSILLGLLVIVVSVVLAVVGVVISSLLTTGPHVNDDYTVSEGSGFLVRWFAQGISTAISFLGSTIGSALVVRAGLDITEGKGLDVGDIFGRIPWAKVFILALIQSAILFVGFLLCILPGIVAAFLLYYATYFVIDRGLEPVDALKASFELVKSNVGSALVWAIVAAIVSVVGLCLCGVGALATLPIAAFGTAYTYKKLNGQPVAA